jgi:hypothetical protein
MLRYKTSSSYEDFSEKLSKFSFEAADFSYKNGPGWIVLAGARNLV